MHNNCNLFFKVHEECKIIKGFNRALVYDLPRQEMSFIDNEIANIICRKNTINELYRKLLELKYENVDKIIDWLISNEYIFLCTKNEYKCFTKMSDEWDHPSIITNSIIDIDKSTDYAFLTNLLLQLDKLNCHNIQLRFFENYSINNLCNTLNEINHTTISNIEILIRYNKNYDNKKIINICKKYNRINRVFVFNFPKEKKIINSNFRAQIYFIKTDIINKNSCGKINSAFFSINIEHYSESQHHNTCLNRKICIDVNGDIKNCPSMKKSYGNIKNTSLLEAIEKSGFKDLWFINKDKIDVCKDCEFRHMCTDCRAYIKDIDNIYSQPAKCPYNPYIAKWEGEEGYVPIEECGTFIKEKGFKVNKRKVNKLNKIIWGD